MKQNRRNFLKSTLNITALTTLAPISVFANDVPNDVFPSHWKFKFLTQPYLQNPTENSITVMWLVSKNAYSYIEYGETESLGEIAKSVNNGLVEANNTLNKITINGLKPNTKYYYRAVSKKISKFHPYEIKFGKTISSEIFSFTTTDSDNKEISMVIMNDLHDRPESIEHLVGLADKNDTDFVFFNGDILSHIDNEKQVVDDLLGVCSNKFASEIPFYLVRGNHELRGAYAREFHKYFSTPSGKPYYDFVYGRTHFTVIDSGEDKEDGLEVYAGLVDFDGYRQEQLEWFNNEVSKSDSFINAKFRVVLMHIPFYYSDDWYGTTTLRKMFASVFNETGIDVCISGHTHKNKIKAPSKGNETNHNYAIIIGGGPSDTRRTLTKLKANDKELKISMLDDNGNEIGSYKTTTKR
jgi:predicted phosphodiesterase